MREDELEVVPLLQPGLSRGIFDRAWLTRLGRAHAEGLRLLATSWTEAYQARFEGPALESMADLRTAMELAAQLGGDFLPLGDPALLGIYRRQQELAWTEHLVERIESELEAAGMLGRSERVPAMSFLDLVGYTYLTEQQGDAAAAALAETLAVLVNRSSREHGGRAREVAGRWGDDPPPGTGRGGAVGPGPGGPAPRGRPAPSPCRGGGRAVVAQGGDYFGRTVNLAAQIAAHAGAGQVLVRQSVADSAPPQGVRFVEQGELPLKGFARPVRLLEACRT
jgi:adenylate cyclase